MNASVQDPELIRLLRADHRHAFAQLYRQHFNMVLYLITRNSGTASDAEDIFQEVMLVLFDKCRDQQFTLSCSLKTYIYSVARNLWLKQLRHTKKQVVIADYEKYVEVPDDLPVDETTGMINRMKAAMESLGENCRKILLMFYYQKDSMEVIAEQLGYTNTDNAKNQKYKCLQQLKKKVQTYAE